MTAQDPELSSALGWLGGISDPVLDRTRLLQMVAALRVAAQQALEALEHATPTTDWSYMITALRAALAQKEEPDLSRCPQCNGPADNGFDRSFPPSPYLCTKCMAEPVEPVAWMVYTLDGKSVCVTDNPADFGEGHRALPLYTAPPQRKLVPLTEEEIKTAFHAARNAKLGASQDNSRHRLSVIEIARAVEKTSWEKNHGQA